MASVSAPPFPSPVTYTDSNPRNFYFRNTTNNKFLITSSSRPSSSSLKKSSPYPHHFPLNFRVSESTICRCHNRPDPPPSTPDDYIHQKWDSKLQDVVRSVIRKFDDYMNSLRNPAQKPKRVGDLVVNEDEVEHWDWERWKKHFEDVEEQERIVSILKSQLSDAVSREDYEDAAKLKVAIAAAAINDTVGRVITSVNRAIEEERYQDAAFFRDNAGAGLVGWWAGISKDSDEPYGRIIRISAEHGRYLARSYSPRHLATAAPGVPLFEIFLTMNDKGEYIQQAVYLKRTGRRSGDSPTKFSRSPDLSSSLNSLSEPNERRSDLSASRTEDVEEIEDRDDDDDSDVVAGMAGLPNIPRDMIPGIKVTVLKVTAPGKVDRDLISKVIEQIMEDEEEEEDDEEEDDEEEEEEEEEDEEKDFEIEALDLDEVKLEAQKDQEAVVLNAGVVSDITQERNEMAVKVVIGGLVQNMSNSVSGKTLLRVPARLDKTDRLSFAFTIDKDVSEEEASGKANTKESPEKTASLRGPRSIDHLMSDLAKSVITKEKIPMKVLKDVGEFINLTLNQAQNRQLLSGTTLFNRIPMPSTSDLLNGLYIGSHGLYTSEVIQLKRKFGQWHEDGLNRGPPNLEFYEYVEAFKLTGDSYVPAGQVAFRAKVGKQYQLPHKGIIPEEFGVVARYKGQGRLAEPGFKNPRWVDGELVILDGKFIRGGPVVGFVYWAPEYQFLVFFHRLKLQD